MWLYARRGNDARPLRDVEIAYTRLSAPLSPRPVSGPSPHPCHDACEGLMPRLPDRDPEFNARGTRARWRGVAHDRAVRRRPHHRSAAALVLTTSSGSPAGC
jgi:hypothetical protein